MNPLAGGGTSEAARLSQSLVDAVLRRDRDAVEALLARGVDPRGSDGVYPLRVLYRGSLFRDPVQRELYARLDAHPRRALDAGVGGGVVVEHPDGHMALGIGGAGELEVSSPPPPPPPLQTYEYPPPPPTPPTYEYPPPPPHATPAPNLTPRLANVVWV